jgi:hypothetical protein
MPRLPVSLLLCSALLTVACHGEFEVQEYSEHSEQAFLNGEGIPVRALLYLGDPSASASGSVNLEVSRHGATYVAEGDILLPPERVVEDPELDLQRGLSIPAALISATPTWQTGVVPFQISSQLEDPGRVTRAIAHWESLTTVRFVARTSEADYLNFVPGDGCASYVGRIGGSQDVWLHPACSEGSAIHEIGHAIGMWHEQSRADRDTHVTVLWQNIQEGRESNFQTYDQQNQRGIDAGAYNLDSIMHYGSYAFSSNGQPTIVRADNGGIIEANRTGLSQGDVEAIGHLYGDETALVEPDGQLCGGATSFTYIRVAGASTEEHEQIARLYCAAFDRLPDPDGFKAWVKFLDEGMSLQTIASYFVDSVEYRNTYGGNVRNEEFVRILYAIVLDRTPDSGGFAAWLDWLAGPGTRAGALVGFSESQEYRQRTSNLF